MLDQPILIVGAMVVGPEFGPLAALCVGIVSRRVRQAARAVGTLALGFAVGITATIVTTWLLDAIGLVERSMLIAERPLTSFIWQPDALSWIVGFLAGIAGMLSLTSQKSGALVGVLISVTTIPAAANAAAALAYWVPDEAVGSLIQLGLNLSAIVVGGVLHSGAPEGPPGPAAPARRLDLGAGQAVAGAGQGVLESRVSQRCCGIGIGRRSRQ